MKKKTYIYLLALVPFLIVAMLYEIVPLITVIVKSFQPDGGTGFTLENYQSVFSKLLYQKAIINSIKISLTSAVAGIIIAFLGARAAHQHQGKLNHVFMTVLNMVSNFAGIPLAFAYMILLGNAGLVVNIGKELGINALSTYNLYTMNGMSLIYIYFQIPLSTLLLIPAFDGVQKQWKEDSRAAADRCRHVFYSDRRTQEMADVPEKIFQCYGVYPRGLLRYPHHQELYRRAGIAGRV